MSPTEIALLETDMASRGFIDWHCPPYLYQFDYETALSIAMDVQNGWSIANAIFYATK